MIEPGKPATLVLILQAVVDGKSSPLHVRLAAGDPWQEVSRAVGFSGHSKDDFLEAAEALWESTMEIARRGDLQEIQL